MRETLLCRKCGKRIDPLEVFPGRKCLACHAAAFDAEVARTGRLPEPDFTAALKPARRKR